jgi:hypothetical protein
MVDPLLGRFSKGLKAGLAAGIIYAGLVAVIVFLFFFIFSATEISNLKQIYPKNATQVYQIILISYPTFYGILGLLVGVIFGVIFGASYKFLVGKTSSQKGAFLGIFMFMFNLLILGTVFYVRGTSSYFGLVSDVVSVVSTVAYGLILGFFYDRFERQPQLEISSTKPPVT